MFSRALIGLVFVSASGCYGTERYDVPVGEAEVTSAPVEVIQAGPTVIYAGRPHYWDGRNWFFSANGRWYYYQYEPTELRDFRRKYLEPRQR